VTAPQAGFEVLAGQVSLDVLMREYPLAASWNEPEIFEDLVEIAGVAIYLVGLCAKRDDGRDVTGSAASVDGVPHERAYFELLERASLLDAVTCRAPRVSVLDERGRNAGHSEHGAVFPLAPPEALFRYALSNGVAAGASFEHASESAFLELVERDRVLRSWYGALPPVRLSDPELGPLAGLESHYRFEVVEFPEDGSELSVVAVFGFPRAAGAPLIRGAGAGRSRAAAQSRAVRECLQSVGFLWGEAVPVIEPTFSTTADYHQEYYLWPRSLPRLRRWLDGERRTARVSASTAEGHRSGRRFADLSPQHLAGRLHVLKALPAGELPLVFGAGHPCIEAPLAEELRVHPVS